MDYVIDFINHCSLTVFIKRFTVLIFSSLKKYLYILLLATARFKDKIVCSSIYIIYSSTYFIYLSLLSNLQSICILEDVSYRCLSILHSGSPGMICFWSSFLWNWQIFTYNLSILANLFTRPFKYFWIMDKIKSCEFLRIFTVAFLLFLAPSGYSLTLP